MVAETVNPNRVMQNSLEELANGFASNVPGPYGTDTISSPSQMAASAGFVLITLNRVVLNYNYAHIGLVDKLVSAPVEDAFRGGVEIETAELDIDELKQLYAAIRVNRDLEAIKDTAKWARLFGGGGLVVATEQDPSTPLEVEALTQDSSLKFIAADRWELLLGLNANPVGWTPSVELYAGMKDHQAYAEQLYNYYGIPIDQTRVMRLEGKTAPSFIRQRLLGWGLSELERAMRSINSYLKMENMVFELLDEAKIDVYRINEFNNNLGSAGGTEMIALRITLANMIKNFKRALVMDKNDEYTQKQLVFSGLAEIYEQIRLNLASDLNMPLSKLFGESAPGFSNGEDSMESYNSMVESEVREKVLFLVDEVVKLRCQQLFGFIPSFVSKFKPLRTLTAVDEQNVSNAMQTRTLELFDRDLLDAQETMDSLDKDHLLNVKSKVQQGLREPARLDETEGDENPKKPSKENSKVEWLLSQRAKAKALPA